MRIFNYKLFVLCTTAIISAGAARAETCMPSDCAEMGFMQTKDECAGYDALVCPYDLSKYFCNAEICGSTYKYVCTGTGYERGSGVACDGKYSSCICLEKYHWQDGSCQQCDSSYNLSCDEIGYKGSTPSCGGYYASCTCADGYCQDSSGNCTQEACLMDYKLILNWTMPWGSCQATGSFGDWTVHVVLYDVSDKTTEVAQASITVSDGRIVQGLQRMQSQTVSFNKKIVEGEYLMRIDSSFSRSTYCSRGSSGIQKVIAGGNTITSVITTDGVIVGLYKRNVRQIMLSAEFGAR